MVTVFNKPEVPGPRDTHDQLAPIELSTAIDNRIKLSHTSVRLSEPDARQTPAEEGTSLDRFAG